MSSTEIIFNQRKKGRTHAAVLTELVLSSDRIVLCSGWMKLDGLQLLLPAIDEAIDKNNASITIYSNRENTYPGVREELSTRKLQHVIVYKEDYYLHSKIFYFESNGKYTAVIGSANITRGGLETNEEMSVKISGVIGDSEHPKVAAYLQHLALRPRKRGAANPADRPCSV
ncbi:MULTISPECIES: phospholipase D-like domain-containing protein [Paraburkholderia]|uniref:phospholipase D-like domain-containing protein n=1 Tax=Paraburkholderia TaxID=1822464 RepID=UPI000371B5E4|nr:MULTISPECIES: phospholipase D-like domain-containing protein [Paraburkholderia]MDH6149325.1 HKD family nuclease [Paraburkholderia sp. WSM4179]